MNAGFVRLRVGLARVTDPAQIRQESGGKLSIRCNLRAHLVVKGQPIRAVNLDTEHGASQASTMRAGPPVAAPRAGTPAEAQALIEQARARARRRRQKTGLAALIAAAAIGGGLAGAGAWSGSGPAAPSGPAVPPR